MTTSCRIRQRERRIFEARLLADDPITLEDLAVEFNVSRERVRQIETRALKNTHACGVVGAASVILMPTQH